MAFHDTTRQPDEPMLRRMTDIMRYRGPDGEGFYCAAGIGLGMCRLRIIDPVTGDQPIANEDGSVRVICNGEIYNYIELREQLLAKGHRFRSRSDTEVIVHLYEDDPNGFLEKLRGMFAFALWDDPNRRLLLVRDRLGIKPLHYAVTREGIVFGSELKTVLASGCVAVEHDKQALCELFRLGLIRAPRTMVAAVRQLLPGQWLSFKGGNVATGIYWDVSFPERNDYERQRSAEQWAEALREKLTEVVRLHLRSDVPVGSWLSGGIDSSAVTALMCRQLRQPFHTFTIGFEDQRVDEVRHNRLLDDYPDFPVVGHRLECSGKHAALVPQAVWHQEQPFRLGVDIPRMLLAEMTAQEVKVVLTGEGADEVLGGYEWYGTDRWLRPLAGAPVGVRELIARVLERRWPGAAWILRSPPELRRDRFSALTGTPWRAVGRDGSFFSEEPVEEPVLPEAFDRWHPFAQLQYLDLKWRMANSVIPRVDRPSMAHSLEARVPFLDHELVEFCARIPPSLKWRGRREKFLLRLAMREVLPSEICWRKKFPMSAPTRELVDGVLPAITDRTDGWFDPARLRALVADHRAGRADHSRILLLIVTMQLWEELFRKRFSCASS